MDKKIAGGLPRHLEVAQWATNNLIACSDGKCRGGEPVHGVAADVQHRARLVGAEYRVGRCDEPHLAPANALGHGRPRAPFVSRLPRVPGRGRLPGRSPQSFATCLRRRHPIRPAMRPGSPTSVKRRTRWRLASPTCSCTWAATSQGDPRNGHYYPGSVWLRGTPLCGA